MLIYISIFIIVKTNFLIKDFKSCQDSGTRMLWSQQKVGYDHECPERH